MNTIGKTKIFVDGNCIVCDAEISHYKKIAPDLFDLVDISNSSFKAKDFNLNDEEVQRNLHLMTPTGEVLSGVDAFAHIWSRIPRYQFVSRMIKRPGLYSLAQVGYSVFVRIRPYLPKKNRF